MPIVRHLENQKSSKMKIKIFNNSQPKKHNVRILVSISCFLFFNLQKYVSFLEGFPCVNQSSKHLIYIILFRRRQWHPTPVLLPGKSHGRRSLVGCSPWSHWGLDTTERLHFHFSLSCIGEGNGNSLQCFCLEKPRDGGAWWAAVYGVAQSWTRLK